MSASKKSREKTPVASARSALRSLTPAEAQALRVRFGLDQPEEGSEDEYLRELAKELSARKRRKP